VDIGTEPHRLTKSYRVRNSNSLRRLTGISFWQTCKDVSGAYRQKKTQQKRLQKEITKRYPYDTRY